MKDYSMPQFYKTHITATTHEFKNNISRFTRLLSTGSYQALFVKRLMSVNGMLVPAVPACVVRAQSPIVVVCEETHSSARIHVPKGTWFATPLYQWSAPGWLQRRLDHGGVCLCRC